MICRGTGRCPWEINRAVEETGEDITAGVPDPLPSKDDVLDLLYDFEHAVIGAAHDMAGQRERREADKTRAELKAAIMAMSAPEPPAPTASTPLASRLRQHAELHDKFMPHDPEQTEWANDLREAADIVERGASETPAPTDSLQTAIDNALSCLGGGRLTHMNCRMAFEALQAARSGTPVEPMAMVPMETYLAIDAERVHWRGLALEKLAAKTETGPGSGSETPADQWQPIGSCPKDGNPFLCGFWDHTKSNYFWVTKAHWAGGVIDGGWDGAREPIELVKAGYWMPLPAAPVTAAETL